MELLNILSAVASILSFFVSLFVATRVVKLGNEIKVKGNQNFTVGGDALL